MYQCLMYQTLKNILTVFSKMERQILSKYKRLSKPVQNRVLQPKMPVFEISYAMFETEDSSWCALTHVMLTKLF